ncbi:MAG TPA: Maf family protein, partial [Chitinophagaceae bacterium]|nr:Maf family protein [Chitinophagaceae bacterium]
MDLPFILVLASASPRRNQLLQAAGLQFEVRLPHAEETWPAGLELEKIPAYLAEKKAASVRNRDEPGEVILGADTLVFLDGRVLGKPRDTTDA